MLSDSQVQKVGSSLRFHSQKLSVFRDRRKLMINNIVGQQYGAYYQEGEKARIPLPLLGITKQIFQRAMASNRPQVLVTAPESLKPYQVNFELAINKLLDRINFADTLRSVAGAGMLGLGVLRIGVEEKRHTDPLGRDYLVHQPFCDSVDMEDFVVDMDASRWQDVLLLGSRFKMTEAQLSHEKYDQDIVRGMKGETVGRRTNEGGDEKLKARQSSSADPSPYMQLTDVWEIYLPFDNVLLTFTDRDYKCLCQEEWHGPPGGPYSLVRFIDVEGMVLPFPPLAELMDMHLSINRIWRTNLRQAERQKTVTLVSANSITDAQRIVKANDGEMVPLENMNASREAKFGGADPQAQAMAIGLRDLYSWAAGNLDVLGGLGPGSGTLGQDQLLTAASSRKVQDMQSQFRHFVHNAVHKLAWFVWHDPGFVINVTKHPIPGLPPLDVTWQGGTQQDVRKAFDNYDVKIEPYSLQDMSPQERLSSFQNVWQTFVVPLLPVLQQQGVQVDVKKMVAQAARYSNMPELLDMLTQAMPVQPGGSWPGSVQDGADPQPQPLAPPVTRHESVRINRGGSTQRGKDNALQMALLGAAQPKVADMAERSVS